MRRIVFLCLALLLPVAAFAEVTPVITASTPKGPVQLTVAPFLGYGQDAAPLGFSSSPPSSIAISDAEDLSVNPAGQVAVTIHAASQSGKHLSAILLYTAGKPRIIIRDDEPIDYQSKKIRISSPHNNHLAPDGRLLFDAYLDLPHHGPNPPLGVFYWDNGNTQLIFDQSQPPNTYDPSLTDPAGIGHFSTTIGEDGQAAIIFYLDKATTPTGFNYATDPHSLLIFNKGTLTKVIATIAPTDDSPELRPLEFVHSGRGILLNLVSIDPKNFRRPFARLLNNDIQLFAPLGANPLDMIQSIQLTRSGRMLIRQSTVWTLTGPDMAHPQSLFQDESDPANTPTDRLPGQTFLTDVRVSDDGYLIFWSRQSTVAQPGPVNKAGIQLRLCTPQGDFIPLRVQDIPAYRNVILSRVINMVVAPGGAVVVTCETTAKKNLAILYHPAVGLRAFNMDDVPAIGNAGTPVTISPEKIVLTADAKWYLYWSMHPRGSGYAVIDLKHP